MTDRYSVVPRNPPSLANSRAQSPSGPYTDSNSELRRYYHEHKGDLMPVALWQLAVAALFAWAAGASLLDGRLDWRAVNLAFGAGIGLWAAFMLADEIVLKYEFERTHELLFIAQLVSLVAMHVLPGLPSPR